MAGELLIFDAAASAVDGTNPGTALNIGPGTNYTIRAFDAPAPPQTIQWASSVDTEGSLAASRKHENRSLTMTILCLTAASLRTLQDKIGKVAREGGTLKWVLPNTETVIFDLLAMDTFAPAITKLTYVRTGAFVEVEIAFPAKPYGRGTATQLADHVETTLPYLGFTETTIAGDWYGLGNLLLDNDGALAWSSLAWGTRSRFYSSASNAKLFYQAESCTMTGAATAAGPAGASGAGNNTAFHQNVSTSLTSAFLLGAGTETHIGDYRVYVRAQLPVANTGIVSVNLLWVPTLGNLGNIRNTAVRVVDNAGAAVEGEWVMLDLGLVSLPQTKVGTQGWGAAIESTSTVATDDIYYDFVALVPADVSGVIDDGTNPWAAGTQLYLRDDGVFLESSLTGTYPNYFLRPAYEGDYLTVSPAAAEARTTEFIVLPLGTLTTGGTSVYRVASFDDLSGRLTYTPRYLVVPSP